MRKTNPILLPGQMVGNAHPTQRGGLRGGDLCKTNPISPGRGGHRRENAQNEPNFPSGADCRLGRGSPGSETCKTNPISPTGDAAAGPGDTRGEMRKTNPI
jgi:hypothetical protein